jgi:hypothetical protein
MLKALNIFLLFIITTQAITTFAEANYPVKLEFEKISQQVVNTLLSNQSVPKIIASSWNKANEKFLASPPSGKIARYDLNDDGLEEVFLYLSGDGLCGRGGCHLIIFQFNKENNRLAYKTAHSSSDDILIVNRLTNSGYHNLAIKLMDGISMSKAKEYTLHQWKDGNLKQTSETISFQQPEDNCD